MNPDLFYTYIYYVPSRNNEPIYVGYGQKDRVWRHHYRKGIHPFTQRLQFMRKNGIKPMIGIYAGLDQEFALFLERELISKFGRKDSGKGSLLNLTDGGEIGPRGRICNFTDEHKNNLSKAMLGVKKSQDAKDNMSRAKKGKPSGRLGILTSKTKVYKIITPDGIFNRIEDAANFYKIGISAIYQRCSKKLKSFQNWEAIKEK